MHLVELVTVGESFEDLVFFGLPRLPHSGEEIKTDSFLHTVGGGAIITAVAASRLGLRCLVLSALSDAATQKLRAERVGFRNLRQKKEAGAISVSLSTAANRSFVTFNGVNGVLEPRLLASTPHLTGRHVHFAFYPQDCQLWYTIITNLRRRGTTTSWDFGWNQELLRDRQFTKLAAAVDYLFVNEAEAKLYSHRPTLAQAVSHWKEHARDTVIKLGGKGARWVRADADLRSPARRVKPVDTTGAGDAFNGGFLYALLRRRSPKDCLRIANIVGALSTRAAGGLESLPRRQDLE